MDWLRRWFWDWEATQRTERIHEKIQSQTPLHPLHPDQFTSLTPEERQAWRELEELLTS